MNRRKLSFLLAMGLGAGLLASILGLIQERAGLVAAGLALLAGPGLGQIARPMGHLRRPGANLSEPERLPGPRPGHLLVAGKPSCYSLPRSTWAGRRYRWLAGLVITALLAGPIPPPLPAAAASRAGQQPGSGPSLPASRPPGCFWADLNCDHFVDVLDIVAMAGAWDCRLGDFCFDPAYDVDGDDWVRIADIMQVINQWDSDPPQLSVLTPAEGQILGGDTVHVSGAASDRHAVTVTVDGQVAALVAGQFSVDLILESGRHAIDVVAQDELGASAVASRLIVLDGDGPAIQVNAPKDRQAVYTTLPAVEITYSDFYADVDGATLRVLLDAPGQPQMDITADLTIEPERAYGAVNTPLPEDTSYTMTLSLRDTLGNETVHLTTFYVPASPASITPPEVTEGAGWVSGVIYDSTTCDEYLSQCQGLAGAQVTLARLNESVLSQARADRAREVAAAGDGMLPRPKTAANVAAQAPGTIVTGPDGFFAFPVAETGRYVLRVEKPGYTYGQRLAEIVRERSAAVNEIFLTPIDPAVTPCDENGCSHTSADGQMQVEIPPGAIPPGEQVQVTATEFDRVNFLPSGELPAGTWETYAFNLGGDSDYTFQQPITVSIKNSRGFASGSEIPVGFWNQQLLQWEHETIAVVDPTGEWVLMQVLHFSNHDPNYPITLPTFEPELEDETEPDKCCAEKDTSGSAIILRSGALRQEVELPAVQVLGQAVAPLLRYGTDRADPSEVIDFRLSMPWTPGITLGDYVQGELYIEGQKTANFTFAAYHLSWGGEVGRFRYLWDGRDAQGNLLPPGVYKYAIHVRIPYWAQYYASLNNRFGGPPDYTRPLRIWVMGSVSRWRYGTVTLASSQAGSDAPFGVGWALDGMQRLYEDEAGHVLIDSGFLDEYYFPGKNLLLDAARSGQLAPEEVTGLHGMYVPEVAEQFSDQWSQSPGAERSGVE